MKTSQTVGQVFEEWMAKVDALLLDTVGMASADLIDVDYAVMFEDGYTPRLAARHAIRENYDE